MSELEHCPFCECEASMRLFYGGKYRVHCNVCDAHSGDTCDTEAEAIEAWNTRAEMAYEDALILLDELGLSERTCKMEPVWGTNALQCSECCSYVSTWDAECEIGKINYCSNCGAKVVDK